MAAAPTTLYLSLSLTPVPSVLFIYVTCNDPRRITRMILFIRFVARIATRSRARNEIFSLPFVRVIPNFFFPLLCKQLCISKCVHRLFFSSLRNYACFTTISSPFFLPVLFYARLITVLYTCRVRTIYIFYIRFIPFLFVLCISIEERVYVSIS